MMKEKDERMLQHIAKLENERVLFKVQIILVDKPEEIDKMETKLLNLVKKEEVVSFNIKKYYQ